MTVGSHGAYRHKTGAGAYGDELLMPCHCGVDYDLRPTDDVRAGRGWSCRRDGCVDGAPPYRENSERRGRPPSRHKDRSKSCD